MSRVAVVGASGMLGTELVRAFRGAGDEVIGFTREDVDLEDGASLSRIPAARPEVVVNAAAWTDVDGCARDPDRADSINGKGAARVAHAAANVKALMVQVSTNEVFDGARLRAYGEDDAPSPINPYGASKLAGERAVADATDHYLIVRTAWLFTATRGFPSRILEAADRMAAEGKPLAVVDDEWGNPTWVPDLADRLAAAIRMRQQGEAPSILHLAGQPPVTRYAWARAVLKRRRPDASVQPIPSTAYARPSRVPPRAVLDTGLAERLGLQPISWQDRLPEDLTGSELR